MYIYIYKAEITSVHFCKTEFTNVPICWNNFWSWGPSLFTCVRDGPLSLRSSLINVVPTASWPLPNRNDPEQAEKLLIPLLVCSTTAPHANYMFLCNVLCQEFFIFHFYNQHPDTDTSLQRHTNWLKVTCDRTGTGSWAYCVLFWLLWFHTL